MIWWFQIMQDTNRPVFPHISIHRAPLVQWLLDSSDSLWSILLLGKIFLRSLAIRLGPSFVIYHLLFSFTNSTVTCRLFCPSTLVPQTLWVLLPFPSDIPFTNLSNTVIFFAPRGQTSLYHNPEFSCILFFVSYFITESCFSNCF